MRPLTWLSLAAALTLVLLATPSGAQSTSAQSPSMRAAPAAPAGTHTLYLIRHGYYDWRDPANERVGKHLDALGREQARLVAKRLKSMPVRFATVRTSALSRAMETGDIIGQVLGLPVTRDSLLNECMPPADRPDLKWDTPGEADSSQAQLEAAWAHYARPTPGADTHEVLAAHGNVIRWFVARAMGADTKRWAHMDIANGSITVITIKPDGNTRLVMYNEVAHLPTAKQTWAGRGPGWETAKVAR